MVRYKYSCKTCKIKDIKGFLYGQQNQPLCTYCKEPLEREFMRPPQNWLRQQNRIID